MSETDTVPEPTSQEKGDRHENEARHILGCTYGTSNVDKCYRYSGNDPLYFIDILAVREPFPTRFVQVKSNQFGQRKQDHYTRFVKRFPDYILCEVWVRVDYEGWEIYQYDHDSREWDLWIKIQTCDKKEAVEPFRQAVGYHDIMDTEPPESADKNLIETNNK